MEEVHDDYIKRDISLFIFPGDFKKLFLGLITQLALPEAHAVLRHHGNLAGHVRVGFLDLCRRIARRDPVIQFFGGLHLPCGNVLVEAYASYRRIVPEETVSQRRKDKGNAGLGIAVCQLQLRALYIQELLLILAHAVELLIRIGLKARGQLVIPADDRLKFSGFHFQGTGGLRKHVFPVADVFLQKDFPLRVEECDLADVVHLGADSAVADLRGILRNLDTAAGGLRFFRQSPAFLRHLRHLRRSHAQAVGAPGLDDHALRVVAVMQRSVFFFKKSKQKTVVRAEISPGFPFFFDKIGHVLSPFRNSCPFLISAFSRHYHPYYSLTAPARSGAAAAAQGIFRAILILLQHRLSCRRRYISAGIQTGLQPAWPESRRTP